MSKHLYKKTIFIFTRDLRLNDNTTLIHALKTSETVIPIFIFNPEQVNDTNKYKSDNCVRFMCESLEDLDNDLRKNKSRLFYFYNNPSKIIDSLLKKDNDINAVLMNKDYSPFAKKREESIKKVCENYGREFISMHDYLLTGDGITKEDGTIYVKFTPFHRMASKKKVENVTKNNYKNYLSSSHKLVGEYVKDINLFYDKNSVSEEQFVLGGTTQANKILKNMKKFSTYNNIRDFPNQNTTHLSSYLKFNVISIREVYHAMKKFLNKNNKLFTQLYWRDFYMLILDNYPHVIGHPMKENYNIKWIKNNELFTKWKNGTTGFPMVDAGMRQLNQTGWMHNRARMVVGNFLVKILHIDWREGEKYFATKLIDFDVANNSGGWQWVSSTGTDSQPYFRIFNPFRQSLKFDKDTEYIKKWVPELKDVPSADIHKWDLEYMNYPNVKYHKPIVDLKKEIKITLKMYKAIY